jgi:hypothetical protein
MKTWIAAAAATMLVAMTFGAFAQNARETLAPTGKLRVGVYFGSPTSMVHDARTTRFMA